jgi:hypothetical protein
LSDLEYLQEFEGLVSVSRDRRRYSLGPNILRAKVLREKQPPAPVKPAVADIPARPQTSAVFARCISDYTGLIETFRERTDQMEIARLELDRIAKLPEGYSGKLLSKRFKKCFGMASLGPVLRSLGLILVVMEDPAARDKTLACREPFDATNRRIGNHCNPRKEEKPHEG